MAYFGTYEVDEATRTITHHIIGSAFPNWAGTVQRRFYELDHDRLRLTTPALPAGSGVTMTGILTWHRFARYELKPTRDASEPLTVTLPLGCPKCNGAIRLHFEDPSWSVKQWVRPWPQVWTCPHCQAVHTGRFPSWVTTVTKRENPTTSSQ